MVDELAPRIHHSGEAFGIGHVRIALADHHIADHPGIGARRHCVDTVGKMSGSDARKIAPRRVVFGMREIVA